MENTKNRCVLVIDDDDFMQELVHTALKQLGFNPIETASHGKEALAKIDTSNSHFDLILCDLNMPEMDGVEFLRHLTLRHFSGDIILFSGENYRILEIAEALARKHKLNVLGSLEKPFSNEKFLALLANKTQHAKNKAPQHKKVTFNLSIDDFRSAMNKNDIILFYQPQVNIHSRKVIGFEALARWIHPDYGMIPPDVFIELAEQHHLVETMTEKLIIMAIAEAANWYDAGLNLKVSINLSTQILNRLDLPEFIESKVQAASLDPSLFVLEITESQLIENLEIALEIISRLSLKRFGLSIDDFGTGYSSMKQLEQIPFTELKIDRAFVSHAADKPTAKAILESSIDLAKKLQIVSVAEGVESQADWDLLVRLGCDIAQGYFIAKPMASDEISDWLTAWQT